MIVIVGAGLAGLSAAAKLTESGCKDFLVLESAAEFGGRVRTRNVDGYRLDAGFHVASTGYGAFRNRLPASSLQPCWFDSGVLLEGEDGDLIPFYHPLQHRERWKESCQAILPRDLARMSAMAAKVCARSDEALLANANCTAREALRQWGFSQDCVDRFFRPFFGGVFLDNELETSVGLLSYYLKKFVKGRAFLPTGGIHHLAEALGTRFSHSHLRLGAEVREVEFGADGFRLAMGSGEILQADALIVAAGPKVSARLLGWPEPEMRPVTTLYFRGDRALYRSKCLILPRRRNPLVRHFVQISNVDTSLSPPGQHLLSATVLDKQDLSDSELFDHATGEITEIIRGAAAILDPLDCIRVPEALPVQSPEVIRRYGERRQRLPDRLFVAGDLASNASQHNAIESGRTAAVRAVEALKGALV